jgi:hypothetical protein
VLESATVAESLLVGGIKPQAEYEYEFGSVRMTSTNHYRPAESRMESSYVFEDEDGTIARRTTCTRPARSCGCSKAPGSATSRSPAPTA